MKWTINGIHSIEKNEKKLYLRKFYTNAIYHFAK